jgi:hypothetical protein
MLLHVSIEGWMVMIKAYSIGVGGDCLCVWI